MHNSIYLLTCSSHSTAWLGQCKSLRSDLSWGVNLCKNNLSEGYIVNLITVFFFFLLLKCSSMRVVVTVHARGCASYKLYCRCSLTMLATHSLLTGLEPLRRSDQPWGVNLGKLLLSGRYIVNLITVLGVFIKMLLIGGVLLLSGIIRVHS